MEYWAPSFFFFLPSSLLGLIGQTPHVLNIEKGISPFLSMVQKPLLPSPIRPSFLAAIPSRSFLLQPDWFPIIPFSPTNERKRSFIPFSSSSRPRATYTAWRRGKKWSYSAYSNILSRSFFIFYRKEKRKTDHITHHTAAVKKTGRKGKKVAVRVWMGKRKTFYCAFILFTHKNESCRMREREDQGSQSPMSKEMEKYWCTKERDCVPRRHLNGVKGSGEKTFPAKWKCLCCAAKDFATICMWSTFATTIFVLAIKNIFMWELYHRMVA